MRAARYYGREDIRVEQTDEPVCGPGELKIRPAFVGICGSDLHEYLHGPTFIPVSPNPHPLTGATLPVTLGHEFSGTILQVGAGVTGFEVNQHVAVQPSISDGTCPACVRGLQNLCHSGGFVGISSGGGGLSDAVSVPASYCLPLPDNVPLDLGALVEPLSVGWHAVSLSPLTTSSTVLVLGGGPIGISVLLALRARGCGDIIVSELSAARQKFSRHFGATHVVDPSKEEDFVKKIFDLTGGVGVDIVFDCAGVAVGLEAACRVIRARGTIVNVAIWEKPVPFNPNDLVFKEGRYMASLAYVKQDFKDVIDAIASGAMKPADMITRRISLEKVVEEGFQALIGDKERQVKILVEI